MQDKKRKPIEDAALLVGGLARNCQETLAATIAALERATAGFRERTILIVESDSDDETVKRLEKLQGEGRLTFVSLGSLQQEFPLRTARIAHCRNHILDFVKQSGSEFDYVMLADMDGLNASLTRMSVEDCWLRSTDWDVVTANQEHAYYDIWALRHPDWVPRDCWQSVRTLERYFGFAEARQMAVHSRQAQIRLSAPLLEVESAFGGLAIYRREAFVVGEYLGLEDGREVCEHVHFHRKLRQEGFRIYINPQLINASPADHLDSIRWKSRLLNLLLYLARRVRAAIYPNVGTYRPGPGLPASKGEE